MELGTEFTTLFVSCGTPITPICPQWLEPLGRPFLIHYIVAGGRSTDLCSAFIMIKRASPGGGEEIFELFRLVFAEGTSTDNVAITLPKPIRVREDDVVGVSRAQGTCAILWKAGNRVHEVVGERESDLTHNWAATAAADVAEAWDAADAGLTTG